MNLYVVVEGEGETTVYPKWISILNPAISRVFQVNVADHNNYYLISGQGYPQYLDIVKRAVEDVAINLQYTRLVIAVDSEDASYEQKYDEIDQFVAGLNCRVQYRIVVQHFCLETWALGNKRIVRRNPSNAQLQEYLALFDTSMTDPELLTPPEDEELNRAQFAFKYLSLMLREKNSRLIYSKRHPCEIGEEYFFRQIRSRFETDHHIQSLAGLLTAFV